MVLSWFCQELRHSWKLCAVILSDAGASVIAEDFEGKSALSAAEENGLPKMRQLLFLLHLNCVSEVVLGDAA